jgi:hypothetical protein
VFSAISVHFSALTCLRASVIPNPGGHSLVSGGLYALVEAAWARGVDLPRHVETLEH